MDRFCDVMERQRIGYRTFVTLGLLSVLADFAGWLI